MLPTAWAPASTELAGELKNLVMITIHPGHVAPAALKAVDVVIAVGREPGSVMAGFEQTAGVKLPAVTVPDPDDRHALVWFRGADELQSVELIASEISRKRHKRKYAHGELGEDGSFYFKGPNGKLNLRAQNLMMFLQMAEGVDDDTWQYHLKCGDYSAWFREKIKDEALAQEAAEVEGDSLDPRASRARIKEAIERRYTGPA